MDQLFSQDPTFAQLSNRPVIETDDPMTLNELEVKFERNAAAVSKGTTSN